MIIKTPTGITCFDEHLGGTFQGRPLLVTGRRNSGKTIFGLQFVKQGLELGERGLMLSMRPTQDLAIYARSIGLNVDAVVDAGELFLLEYNDVVPGRDCEENITLPPEGFAQLIDIIGKEFIRRVVIDTVVPWVVMVSRDHLAEHIFSFVRAFERLGVTALFTCSHPVSTAAQHAHRILETNVPVSLTLSYDATTENRLVLLNKYIGAVDTCKSMPYRIEQNRGIVCIPPDTSFPEPAATPKSKTVMTVPPAPIPVTVVPPLPVVPPAAPTSESPKTMSFAASMLEDSSVFTAATAPQTAVPPAKPPETKPNFADAMFRPPNKDR